MNFWIYVIWVLCPKYPTKISSYITVSWAVRIQFRVRITVMCAVQACPPDRRALKPQVTADYKKIFDKLRTFKTSMCKKPMIAYRCTKHMPDVKCEKIENEVHCSPRDVNLRPEYLGQIRYSGRNNRACIKASFKSSVQCFKRKIFKKVHHSAIRFPSG